MSTDHLALWSAVEKTDPAHTKGFSRGGGFKGTATNATYLAMRATEQFGPCGTGWGLTVLKEEVLEGAPLFDKNGAVVAHEKIHTLHARLWYMRDGARGEIEHFGQTTFVGQNSRGIFTDEEAPKKSLTDAMSKCLSLLGFSADIHMGRYDDNKYVADLKREFAAEQGKTGAASSAHSDGADYERISEAEAATLREWIQRTGTDIAAFCKAFKINAVPNLPASAFGAALAKLQAKANKQTTTTKE